MDLREYAYISGRPDTFPKTALQFIRAVLSRSGVYDGIALIDKVLSTGYIQPPPEYPYHGYYQVILDTSEIKRIIDYLNDAKSKLSLLAEDLRILDFYVEELLRCLNEKPVSYADYKAIHPYYDLREISVEDFQKFIFDRAIVESIEDRLWYLDAHLWIDGDFEHIASLYIKIFSEADKLLGLFTRQQLEQGLSIIGNNGLCEFTVLGLIFITKINIELKKALIWSMFDVHQKLFSIEQLNPDLYDIYVYNDWWVRFAISVHSRPLLIAESAMQQIQNTIFEVLTKILVDDSCGCKYAAFRGLKYLKHPDTKSFIEAYISKYQDVLSDGFIKEARWCIKEDIIS